MTQDLTRQYYQLHADEYFSATVDVQLTHLWDVFTRELPADALILDLGCGSGRDLRYFSGLGFRVVGLDYSFRLLTLAKNFSHRSVVLGDINSLPFGASVFDAVWSVGSLLHISRSELPSVLAQIHSSLKPNGQFLASMKMGTGEIVDSLGRRNVFYKSQDWSNLMEDAGFQINELDEIVEPRRIQLGDDGVITWIMCLATATDKEQTKLSPEAEELSLASGW